jgi:hypothetical protein
MVLAGASQIHRLEAAKAEITRVEPGMLAGQDQAWLDVPGGQRSGDRGKLDGFGTSTDDQPYVGKTQSSP